ncbi:MAG: acyltransferase [Pseudomonadota bacterium]
MNRNSHDDPGFFVAVDTLSGLAALVVLFWHYQHFYFLAPDDLISAEQSLRQPGYAYLSFLYEKGSYAVHLFWMLSGFIFAHAYLNKDEIDTADFVTRRFARIFPLHYATLAAVVILQVISFTMFGRHQIYDHNDVPHFVMNLFGASHWGWERGLSFNGPFWSVSVELWAYAAFILMFPMLRRFPLLAPVFTILAYFLWLYLGIALTQCLAYFATGLAIWTFLVGPYRLRLLTSPVAIAIYVPIFYLAAQTKLEGGIATIIAAIALLSIAVAIDETFKPEWRLGRYLGEISYTVYMVHTPIQIAILILVDAFGLSRALFDSPVSLIVFFACTFALANIVRNKFEKPMRRYLTQPRKQKRASFQSA